MVQSNIGGGGGGGLKKFFSALWASFWSKNKGGPSPGFATAFCVWVKALSNDLSTELT